MTPGLNIVSGERRLYQGYAGETHGLDAANVYCFPFHHRCHTDCAHEHG